MAALAVKPLLRRSLLTITALVSAALSLSCSDNFLGGRGGRARIVLQSELSQRDAAIYRSLESFGLAVSTLHVVLTRAGTEDVVAEQSITLADGQDEVLVSMDVIITGTEELLTATIEMRSGETILFAGSLNVLARAGAAVGGPIPVLVPVWVGPGSQATHIEILPRNLTIPKTGSVAFTATAYDANGLPVGDPEYVSRWQWRVNDATLGTIPLAGGGGLFVGANKDGVALVSVFTPNLLADTVRVTLVTEAPPPLIPTQLFVARQPSATAVAGVAFATQPVVHIRDASGSLVPTDNTTQVTATVIGGNAVLGGSATVTAVNGVATFTNLSYTLAGPIAISFTSVPSLTGATSNSVVVGPGAPAQLTIATQPAPIASPNVPFTTQPVVHVLDAHGNHVTDDNATRVTASRSAGTGALTGTLTVTAANGVATFTNLQYGISETLTVAFAAPGLTGAVSSEVIISPPVPVSLTYGRALDVISIGATSTVPAVVRDATGAAMPGAPISYVSRAPGVAAVNATGVISGVAKGQAIVVATADGFPALTDSVLVVVADPNGPVVISSIDRFTYGAAQTVTLSVFVDFRASTRKLGSATIDVEWDPAQLAFQRIDNGASGVTPTVNTATAPIGILTMAMADVAGFGGRVEMLRITFTTSASPSLGQLRLVAREMTATIDFFNLLAVAVQVTHPLSIQ